VLLSQRDGGIARRAIAERAEIIAISGLTVETPCKGLDYLRTILHDGSARYIASGPGTGTSSRCGSHNPLVAVRQAQYSNLVG
jgi:hypothetical protein